MAGVISVAQGVREFTTALPHGEFEHVKASYFEPTLRLCLAR